MQIYDFNNKLEKELLIKSENWLVGASYLGEEDDHIIVQTHETDSYPNLYENCNQFSYVVTEDDPGR